MMLVPLDLREVSRGRESLDLLGFSSVSVDVPEVDCEEEGVVVLMASVCTMDGAVEGI